MCAKATPEFPEMKKKPRPYSGGGRVELLTLVGPALSSESKWFEGLTEDPAKEIKSLQSWIHASATAEKLDEGKGENARLEVWKDVLLVSSLCSISRLHANQDGTLVGSGNPTELALQELIHKAAKATPEVVHEEACCAEKYVSPDPELLSYDELLRKNWESGPLIPLRSE